MKMLSVAGVFGFLLSPSMLLYSHLALAQTPRPGDAVQDAQTPKPAREERVEQRKSAHDGSAIFDGGKAPASSTALDGQPDKGRAEGFDFARDPLNAKRPKQPAEEIMQQDIAPKPKVMADQRRLLESRYDLTPRLDASATMSRGEPLTVGPTARLASGVTWQTLAAMKPDEMRSRGAFPYPALPHPKHAAGGMVFPQFQIDMFPRLERFDVDFDLLDAFYFHPPSFYRTAPSSETYRAAKWCRSTTISVCSRIC